MLTHPPTAIERIVEAIKGYFSIVGLLLAGLYMIHSPFRSTRLLTWISYAGGYTAVLCGTVICVWYSAFLLKALLVSDDFHEHHLAKKALFWFLMAMAGRDQSIRPSVFFSRGALLANAASCSSGWTVPAWMASIVWPTSWAPRSASRISSSAAVSSGPMATRDWATHGPASNCGVMWMMVAAVSVSPW